MRSSSCNEKIAQLQERAEKAEKAAKNWRYCWEYELKLREEFADKITELRNQIKTLGGSKSLKEENNVELKNCPCCGGTVMLCKTGYLITTGADFSLVCTECGMEFKLYVNPMSNVMCDTEQNKLKRLLESFNRRC